MTELEENVVPDNKVNTQVDLLSYHSFEIVGSDPDEIAAKWKNGRGFDFYIEAIGTDKTLEKARLKSMYVYVCISFFLNSVSYKKKLSCDS